MQFSARIISGSGIAGKQNVPTLNLAVEDVPKELHEGIYACRAEIEYANTGVRECENGVMHYGPRHVHHLPRSCEVHLLDQTIEKAPQSMAIEVVQRIRDVQDFQDSRQLQKAIQSDIAVARAILTA